MKKIDNIKKYISIFKKKLNNNISASDIIEYLNNINFYDKINKTKYLKECYQYMILLSFNKNNDVLFILLKESPLAIENLYEIIADYLVKDGNRSLIDNFFSKLYDIYDKSTVTYNFVLKISEKIPSYSSTYFIDDVFQDCFKYFEEKDFLNLIKFSFENINSSNLHSDMFITLCYMPWNNYFFSKEFLNEIDDLLSLLISNIFKIEEFSEPISQLINALMISNENYILEKDFKNKAVKSFIDAMVDKCDASNIKNLFLLLDEIIPLKYLILKIKKRTDIDLDYYIKEYLIYHPDLDNIKAFI